MADKRPRGTSPSDFIIRKAPRGDGRQNSSTGDQNPSSVRESTFDDRARRNLGPHYYAQGAETQSSRVDTTFPGNTWGAFLNAMNQRREGSQLSRPEQTHMTPEELSAQLRAPLSDEGRAQANEEFRRFLVEGESPENARALEREYQEYLNRNER